jgi:hypothetical protein
MFDKIFVKKFRKVLDLDIKQLVNDHGEFTDPFINDFENLIDLKRLQNQSINARVDS